MERKTLVEEFEITKKKTPVNRLIDYDIFPNKELLESLRNKIIENIVARKLNSISVDNEFIIEEINSALEGYDLSSLERSHIFNLIDNEINGFGPLTEALQNPHITSIMVNDPQNVYIEFDGKRQLDDTISFINDEHIIQTIKLLIEPAQKTIDKANPIIDVRLEGGLKINAIIPPLSLSGPIMTIHKSRKSINNIDELIRIGTLTPYMARFLESAVQAKLNIILSGGPGSGKTTLLNVLSNLINHTERVITIEEIAELELDQKHVISLETEVGGLHKITTSDLIKTALKINPDRLVIGEINGKETFEVLQTINTGLSGLLTTIYATSCQDALKRLETLVLMSGIKMTNQTVQNYIENSIDLLVHIEKLSDGKRKITSICELDSAANGQIKLNEIFAFTQESTSLTTSSSNSFILHEANTKSYDKIKKQGITSIDDIFNKEPIPKPTYNELSFEEYTSQLPILKDQ